MLLFFNDVTVVVLVVVYQLLLIIVLCCCFLLCCTLEEELTKILLVPPKFFFLLFSIYNSPFKVIALNLICLIFGIISMLLSFISLSIVIALEGDNDKFFLIFAIAFKIEKQRQLSL